MILDLAETSWGNHRFITQGFMPAEDFTSQIEASM